MILSLIESLLIKIAPMIGDLSDADDEDLRVFYYPTLADIDFKNPFQTGYLMGKDETYNSSIPWKSVAIRNKNWWKKNIDPLLNERSLLISSKKNQTLSPILIEYGKGHNENPFSILKMIEEKKEFTLEKLTRQGWLR